MRNFRAGDSEAAGRFLAGYLNVALKSVYSAHPKLYFRMLEERMGVTFIIDVLYGEIIRLQAGKGASWRRSPRNWPR